MSFNYEIEKAIFGCAAVISAICCLGALASVQKQLRTPAGRSLGEGIIASVCLGVRVLPLSSQARVSPRQADNVERTARCL